MTALALPEFLRYDASGTLLNLRRSAHEVAPDLIGSELYVDGVGGVIVEVEAYDHEDPGCARVREPAHASATRRCSCRGGHAYVYRSYGIHWCLNVVCGDGGRRGRRADPGAASRRAASGADARAARRVASRDCSARGPGRLTQALGVTRRTTACRSTEPPFELQPRTVDVEIVTGPRIGITKAVDQPWRYGLAGSRFVSRPFRALTVSVIFRP